MLANLASALLAASQCHMPSAQRLATRRSVVHGVLAGSGVFALVPASIAETSPGDLLRQERQERLTNPYGDVRTAQPGRAPFADEFAPLTAEERQQRAAAAKQAAQNVRAAPQVSKAAVGAAAPTVDVSDEFTVAFDAGSPLGLELKDLRVGFETGTTEGTSRVLVKSVVPGSQAARSGRLAVDNIVVAVDGVNVERENARQVQKRVKSALAEGGAAQVTFKDALAFNAQLKAPTGADAEAAGQQQLATTIAPATESSEAQVLGVRRVSVPSDCRRNADNGDLLEIRYAGRLADGTVFDGMQLADRFGDDSIQFVLGRQPAGQFPPSWDVGLQGICVGERREIDVPPVLGFGEKGLVKKGKQLVPPNARLLYDVECVAINALATP